MKKSRILHCLQIVEKNNEKHPLFNTKGRLHYSFIFVDNKLIEWGTNNTAGIPPIHMGYRSRINGFDAGIHSELSAYRKAKGLLNNSEFECLNIRVNKSAQLKMSMPCKCCYNILTTLGCKTFYYSSEVGFLKL